MGRGLADEDLLSAIESILLVAGEPVSAAGLASAFDLPKARVLEALHLLQRELARGIRLQVHGDEVQLVSAPENTEVVQRFLGVARPAPVSRAALEALTVIAYRQPATRAEVEAARGVNSDRAMQTLLARGLIEERGHRPVLGRPMEYGTTFAFLEYFGLSSLQDLPPVADKDEESIDGAGIGMRSSQAR